MGAGVTDLGGAAGVTDRGGGAGVVERGGAAVDSASAAGFSWLG